MGVEPFLIASAVEAILAQRLVRCICLDCKHEYIPTAKQLEESDIEMSQIENKKFYKGSGCSKCNNSGYRGRAGVFELIILDEDLRSLILDRATVGQLRDKAIENGMRTLREDALLKVYRGITTLEELINISSNYT